MSPPGVGRPDRPLGRGLEDVSRVFLSQGTGEQALEAGPIRRAVRPLPRAEGAPSPVLLRPSAQVGRDAIAEALREYAGALEEGLKVVDGDIACGPCGEIDLLALDRASQLAVLDFATDSCDDLLIRGLGHLDWMAENLGNLRRMLRGYPINFSLPARLFLLAPRFSSRLLSAARQVTGVQVDWVRYQVVDTPGRTGIFFERLEPSSA